MYLEVKYNAQVVHEISSSTELELCVDVITSRDTPDNAPQFLLLDHRYLVLLLVPHLKGEGV